MLQKEAAYPGQCPGENSSKFWWWVAELGLCAASTRWKRLVLQVLFGRGVRRLLCLSPLKLMVQRGKRSKMREGELHGGCRTNGETEVRVYSRCTFSALLSSAHLSLRCCMYGISWVLQSHSHPSASQQIWDFPRSCHTGLLAPGWFCASLLMPTHRAQCHRYWPGAGTGTGLAAEVCCAF